MIDTEITLRGHAAEEFFRQMMSADMSSIRSRDMFIADAGSSIDESGVLTIDASDLDIDLSVLDEPREKTIEAHPTPKKERYSINIVIQYTSSSANDIYCRFKKNNSYEINNYYKSDEHYSTNRNKSFEYAA